MVKWLVRRLLGEREIITNGRAYVAKRYGDKWWRIRRVTLRGFQPQLMSDYPATQHCSLASVTAVVDYYAQRDWKKRGNEARNPNTLTRQAVFETVSRKAYSRLLSSPQIGTFPWNIARISRLSFAEFGYEVAAKNRCYLRCHPTLARLLKSEINHGRPVIVSFSHNQYFSHTVTAYGYEEYINTQTQEKKALLVVADNWSRSERLVDLTRAGDWKDTFVAISLVRS